ncbi:MAG TPA: type II secretion system protein [Candidatus Paceibacterota bacterium]|nr:type II secretion system protein [Verrucomicrobiota bacterium]HSA09904.1 type II secretion system protein [Candidatus Paceibacterota bacterium]
MLAQPPRNSEKSAFSLVELLVIIAAIALLATLRLSALAPAEVKAHRLGCLNNLKQLGLGSMMYANDSQGHYSGHTWLPGELGNVPPGGATDRSGSDDDLNWLYPRYVKSTRSFVCPSTQNYIRTNLVTKPTGGVALVDLCKNGATLQSAGTSYEVSGNFTLRMTGMAITTKKKEDTVNAFTIGAYVRALGMKPGPSRVFLIMDADDTLPGVGTDANDWPDNPADNHGAAGANFSFCDGHAQWVRQNEFMEVWNISQDSNRSSP